jgi:hypothetical protein
VHSVAAEIAADGAPTSASGILDAIPDAVRSLARRARSAR